MPFEIHPWKVIETAYAPQERGLSDTLMTLANGSMGMPGSMEEEVGGCTYLSGVYDASSAARCMRLDGIRLLVDGEPLCLKESNVLAYRRELQMQDGLLVRTCTLGTEKGKVKIRSERFVSANEKELFATHYSVTADFAAQIELRPCLDARQNDEWERLAEEDTEEGVALLTCQRGGDGIAVAAAMSCWSDALEMESRHLESGYAESVYRVYAEANETVSLEKYVLLFTSRDYDQKVLTTLALRAASRAREIGYDELRDAQKSAWRARWYGCDIEIEGDDAAQQDIRFGMFQLLSTYSGDEEEPHVGPMGFGGSKPAKAECCETITRCLPFYLSACGQDAGRQLLSVPHSCLDHGNPSGTSFLMQPGHPNALISHAVFAYATETGDYDYMLQQGLELLCGVARFYTDRALFVEDDEKYVIPGEAQTDEECEQGQWHLNRLAAWCIGLFLTRVHRAPGERLEELGVTEQEMAYMMDVMEHMNLPEYGWKQDENPASALLAAEMLEHLCTEDELHSVRMHCAADPADSLSVAAGCGMASCFADGGELADGLHHLRCMPADETAGLQPALMGDCWLAFARGAAGLRTVDDLTLAPVLPAGWQGFSMRIQYRGRILQVAVRGGEASVELLEGRPLDLVFYGQSQRLEDRIAAQA